jgi:hypothetical protein
MDNSCRVPHDVKSAIIDRLARNILWRCCGRSAERIIDMAPLDGWCYEGRHTVSIL